MALNGEVEMGGYVLTAALVSEGHPERKSSRIFEALTGFSLSQDPMERNHLWDEGNGEHGTPGQVVISQTDGVKWLLADSAEGNLKTELKGSGRSTKQLQSQTNITDGVWHRIGFVWDGSNRMLYVDDIMVAQDTQDDLEGLNSGLYIGTSNFMQPGTYYTS